MLNNTTLINRSCLAIIWGVTGALSLGLYPLEQSVELLASLDLEEAMAQSIVICGGLLDLAMAGATVFFPGKRLWKLQLLVVVVYSLLASWIVPGLWLHPLGPLLKNLAVVAVLLTLLEQEKAHTC